METTGLLAEVELPDFAGAVQPTSYAGEDWFVLLADWFEAFEEFESPDP